MPLEILFKVFYYLAITSFLLILPVRIYLYVRGYLSGWFLLFFLGMPYFISLSKKKSDFSGIMIFCNNYFVNLIFLYGALSALIESLI
jgi:hypothetical protein